MSVTPPFLGRLGCPWHHTRSLNFLCSIWILIFSVLFLTITLWLSSRKCALSTELGSGAPNPALLDPIQQGSSHPCFCAKHRHVSRRASQGPETAQGLRLAVNQVGTISCPCNTYCLAGKTISANVRLYVRYLIYSSWQSRRRYYCYSHFTDVKNRP